MLWIILTLFLFRNLSSEPDWHFPLWFSSSDSARSLPPRDNVYMPPACYHLWNSLLLDFVYFCLMIKEACWVSQSTLTSTSALTSRFPHVRFHLWTFNEHYNVSGRQKGMSFLEGHEFGDSDQFSSPCKTFISLSAVIGHSLKWCHKLCRIQWLRQSVP